VLKMRKLKSVVVTIIKKYLRLIKHKRVKRVQKALELKIKTGEISPPHLPVYSFGVRIKWSPNLQADGYVYTAEFLFDEELFSTKKYTFISESNDVQLKVTPRRVAHSLPHGRNVDAMVIVPHGDDELFLCGSIIREKVLAGEYVIVAFINNCDHNGRENARLRHMQSVAAMDLLGLSAEHIVLLGYSNSWEKNHIYHAGMNEVCQSTCGDTETYGSDYLTDFHYLIHGKHATYTRKNLTDDIELLIARYLPQNIYAIDYDTHPDHRAGHLLCCEALRTICKQIPDYRPIVHFGFAYSTSCYAPQDFLLRIPVGPVKKPTYLKKHIFSDLPNPSYKWKDRISIPAIPEFTQREYNQNLGAQSLICYDRMYSSIESFLNADMVFWQRRMDNLALYADCRVSSGCAKYLNDNKRFDTLNVRGSARSFDAGIWRPDDEDMERTIRFLFEKPQEVAELRLYQSYSQKERIKKVRVTMSTGFDHYYSRAAKKGYPWIILPKLQRNVTWVEIRILALDKNAGLTEIEFFSTITPRKTNQCYNAKYAYRQSIPFYIPTRKDNR
jgi:LmbE family N-acetylglucosaminyl deacetylase